MKFYINEKKYNKVFMNKKIKYIYHLAFVFFLSIMLINCEAKVSSHGKVIESHNYNKLEIGKSDVYDVIRILGKPSFMGAFGSRKFYYARPPRVSPSSTGEFGCVRPPPYRTERPEYCSLLIYTANSLCPSCAISAAISPTMRAHSCSS